MVFEMLRIYLNGPRLLRIFPSANAGSPVPPVFQTGKNADCTVEGRTYLPNTLEWFADKIIKSISLAASLTVYISPVFAYYFLRRGETLLSNVHYILKCLSVAAVGISVSAVIRGYGRITNNDYKRFAKVLYRVKFCGEEKMLLRSFDFEFMSWPVDFKWSDASGNEKRKPQPHRQPPANKSFLASVIGFPLNVIDYIIAHGAARPMAYPGSVSLLQLAFAEPLLSGRAMLIEKNGQRAKLLAEDGNEIDTMFIDKRQTSNDNGKTLVVCCEGNAGFYEVGIIGTPKKAGYSVLGWNHPGFAGSSGLPFPEAERNAVDVVMQYAISKLGFAVEDIVIFAWSIGAYPGTYAAMTYPDVKALVVDASFDHIIPLALERMPPFLSNTVSRVITKYFDLNHADQMVRYPGPIRLIRRSREEIITTIPDRPSSNRGNDLLIKLLRYRYPNILSVGSEQMIRCYLAEHDPSTQEGILSSLGVDVEACASLLRSYTDGKRPVYPLEIGADWDEETKNRISLFLVLKHMDHFDATHCMPLPSSYFNMPWDHE